MKTITRAHAKAELTRRNLPNTDKRRSLWRTAAIKRGTFNLTTVELKTYTQV